MEQELRERLELLKAVGRAVDTARTEAVESKKIGAEVSESKQPARAGAIVAPALLPGDNG